MEKLLRRILENVARAFGDITFSDWNGQTIIKAEGISASIRYCGIFALAVSTIRATQQVLIDIF